MIPRLGSMTRLLVTGFCVLGFLPLLRAQAPDGPQVDLAEILRQIRRNMAQVEKDLDKVQAESAKAQAREAKENLDRLVEQMKSRGQQIVKDIDEFIQNLPPPKGGGGGGGGQNQPQDSQKEDQSKAKDRNKPQGQQKPEERQKKPQNGQQEDNTAKNPKDGRNRTSPPRPEEKKRIQQQDLEGRWGFLPPELRQKLVDRNFQEFTPEYQEEIKAYYRKIATGQR